MRFLVLLEHRLLEVALLEVTQWLHGLDGRLEGGDLGLAGHEAGVDVKESLFGAAGREGVVQVRVSLPEQFIRHTVGGLDGRPTIGDGGISELLGALLQPQIWSEVLEQLWIDDVAGAMSSFSACWRIDGLWRGAWFGSGCFWESKVLKPVPACARESAFGFAPGAMGFAVGSKP